MTTYNPYEPWAAGGRIVAMVGHYGSGKTEVALNMALSAQEHGLPSTVVDMDIVNPFFRSAEQGELLARRGVSLIAPPYARTGVDLPVLSAEIMRIFEEKERFRVLDVGGDDAGAAALGRFKPQLDHYGVDAYLVVNPFRPYSRTKEQVVGMLRKIEDRARTRVTGLINNANLGDETGAAELFQGQALLEAVRGETGVPIVCACGAPHVLKALEGAGVALFPMERLLMPEWLL